MMGERAGQQDRLFYQFCLACRWFCRLGIEDTVPDQLAGDVA